MDSFADIDLDAEAIWLDGAWHTREALADRIKQMVESGEYRVARLSEALERLEAALARTRILSSRVPEDLAEAMAAAGAHLGRPVGHLVREALSYYLAAAAAHAAAQKRPAVPGGAAPGDDERATSLAGKKA